MGTRHLYWILSGPSFAVCRRSVDEDRLQPGPEQLERDSSLSAAVAAAAVMDSGECSRIVDTDKRRSLGLMMMPTQKMLTLKSEEKIHLRGNNT
jgi:hypothetical protein